VVRRVYVEKKPGFDIAAKSALSDFRNFLGKSSLSDLRLLNRYDVEGAGDSEFEEVVKNVFSEPAADFVYYGEFDKNPGDKCFAVEYLPGQYDQRADSAVQCIELLNPGNPPVVKCATVYVLSGITDCDLEDIKKYVINPVDSREAGMDLPETLKEDYPEPDDVEIIEGFRALDETGLRKFLSAYGLAMSFEDLMFVQKYFAQDERRDPTIAEIRVIDTYWSDHCRHTTFLTELKDVAFDETAKDVENIYNEYLRSRESVHQGSRSICLMDIATLYAKEARKNGLPGLDVSEEINACSIKEKVIVDGKPKDYLIMFKNETHNHPTEIEPFGGAATCLGGAIRDPLSGRSYVYHAMRVTGSADPRESVKDTLPGKLPQRKICREAARGFSSYGNQIGLATGIVDEIYHPGYKAKRMEIGAVIGAAPAENVVRKKPREGDYILLLGGATGRDGCGGATGSSKAHNLKSIESCGAEVQKGNPITERKLQRLFRNREFSTIVKRCNDFGAGGVCVAIGELAPGVRVDLDRIRKKYEGLGGVELAISESQERMAVVIAPEDLDKAQRLAREENLHADKVAEVTGDARMELLWRGKPIVSLKRSFLDTNGATASASARVAGIKKEGLFEEPFSGGFRERLIAILSDLNVCSKKGLIEMFDSTIGAGTVNMPLGGAAQLTPIQAMAAKVPADGECETATLFSYGFDPYLMEKNPFLGAMYSVVLSLAKLVCAGGDISRAWLTFQEYFEKLSGEESWGKPLAALLGGWWAQKNMQTPAIGGKDSMSGTFDKLNVPPTLVSFALCTQSAGLIISPEFKKEGSGIYRVRAPRLENGMPDFEKIRSAYSKVGQYIRQGKILSAFAVERGGVLAAVAKMAFGNNIGASLDSSDIDDLTSKAYGDLILEGEDLDFERIGVTGGEDISFGNESVPLSEALAAFESTLSKVYPVYHPEKSVLPETPFESKKVYAHSATKARPRIAIPVFPGTNCEFDTAEAFRRAGGIVSSFVIRNISDGDIEYSIRGLAKLINESQILALPGGFSSGDEPDGSGKFIVSVLRAKEIRKALERLLERDGLILGICNGFQALIKSGLLPYGQIRDMEDDSPTLTFNAIGRHISKLVRTKVTSNASPWLSLCRPGDIHTVAISHGEGRFVCPLREAEELLRKGQVATQYVDKDGDPCGFDANPNGSVLSIEGLLSPDGRIFGKMAHSERFASNTFKNVPGDKNQKIFESGVNYFL